MAGVLDDALRLREVMVGEVCSGWDAAICGRDKDDSAGFLAEERVTLDDMGRWTLFCGGQVPLGDPPEREDCCTDASVGGSWVGHGTVVRRVVRRRDAATFKK